MAVNAAPRHAFASAAVAITALAAGCAASPTSRVRFANAEPVWRVNDRMNIAKPANPGFPRVMYFFDRFVFRRITRLLEIPAPAHAGNVNSLDEVPDSTWFTNRIGVRDLGPADIARGPHRPGRPGTLDPRPDRSRPWRVKGTKVGGVAVGFVIVDGRGVEYILKFDRPGEPETETGAAVVIQRLLWASGFHVPEESIVTLTRDQLILDDDATIADTFGNRRPMTTNDLDQALTRVDRHPDGSYRALASKVLAGVPVGGVAPEGVRADDGNDVVPHQERRELRGQYVFFSWLDHTDVKYDNMLDVWVQDPGDPSIHYLMHYLVDFGNGLGTLGKVENRDDDGFAHAFDFQYGVRSFFGVGLWRRPWEGVSPPALAGVGWIDSEHFEPDSWRPQYPWMPFRRRDRHDGFWAARIIARFTPELIRAAVEQGQYSDPRTIAYLTRILQERRDKIVRYWLGQVTPLADFAVVELRGDGPGVSESLCFADLAVVHGLAPAGRGSYRVTVHDYQGRELGDGFEVHSRPQPETGSPLAGRICVGPLPTGRERGGYTIVKIVPRRLGAARHPVEAHLAREPSGSPGRLRVIGVHRW